MLTNKVAMDIMSIDIQMINQEPMEPERIHVRSIFNHLVVQKPRKVFKDEIQRIA